MNFIWIFMIIFSIVYSFFNGSVSGMTDALFSSFEKAAKISIFLAVNMSFWSGIMEIASESHLTDLVSKLFSPLLKFIFPSLPKKSKARKYIVMNMTANLLGLGNAATPLGINAVKELDRENSFSEYASDSMCRFVILNTSSIQLIPTTVIALRSSAMSKDASSIIIPIWITSAVALLVGLISASISERSYIFR